jgi:hypothetical protein
LLAIPVLLRFEPIPQGGPLRRGRIRAVPEAHQHLGAERLPVELDGLLAAAVEEEVGLDSHMRLLPDVGSTGAGEAPPVAGLSYG